MKKCIIIFLPVLMLVMACSLDEKMVSTSSPSEYYTNESQCRAALNGCYQPLRNIYNSKNYFQICEVQTDLMFSKRRDQVNATLQVSPSAPQFGANMWENGYLGVMRANAVCAGIERSELPEEQKEYLMAEAVVLRSMFYYILTSNFGDVPFYKDEVTKENNSAISKLPRMDASAIRKDLIAELRTWVVDRKALDWKPTNSGDNRQQYRCGAALGLYLAGKMSLWEKDWAAAIEYFGYLEEIYGPLYNYPLSDIPFNKRNTPEVILEVSNISVDFGLHIYGALASYTTPMRSDDTSGSTSDLEEEEEIFVDSGNNLYDGIRIPELGQHSYTHVPIRPTRKMCLNLMPWDGTDRRRSSYEVTAVSPQEPGAIVPVEDGGGYMAWGWPGYAPEDEVSDETLKYHLFASVQKRSWRPYLGNKFWCFGMQHTMDDNSYKAFRYAGAILGLAEAWFGEGDYDKACEYLNMVKQRAGIARVFPKMYPDKDELLLEIQDEYARELFGEFQRKHDLVRWGIWYDSVMKYNVGPKADGGEDNTVMELYIKPCHEYYPIPDEQIVYSGGALDNDEYNKWGL